MAGGEVFVPKLPAATLWTIYDSVVMARDKGGFKITGLRPGEKMHELLVSRNEAARTLDRGWHYLVTPLARFKDHAWDGTPVPVGFEFGSDTAQRLDVDEFRALAGLAPALEVAS
jgi:UDP-N-acetylglucosamine 4,6-dehydratase